jgi:hypothetical protein
MLMEAEAQSQVGQVLVPDTISLRVVPTSPLGAVLRFGRPILINSNLKGAVIVLLSLDMDMAALPEGMVRRGGLDIPKRVKTIRPTTLNTIKTNTPSNRLAPLLINTNIHSNCRTHIQAKFTFLLCPDQHQTHFCSYFRYLFPPALPNDTVTGRQGVRYPTHISNQESAKSDSPTAVTRSHFRFISNFCPFRIVTQVIYCVVLRVKFIRL